VSDSNRQITVSAVVVTFNSRRRIVACLEALKGEIESVSGEILLSDNRSSDETVTVVSEKFPDIRIFEAPRNIGFAAAANAASLAAEGKFLLFANPDMIIDKGALAILLESYGIHSDTGAVAARMRNPDGSFQATCRQLPTYRNILFSRRSSIGSGLWKGRAKDIYTLGDFADISEVPAAAATCLLIEKQFFHSLGGFDRRFFMFMEDTDLCLRIRNAGKRVYFVPQAGGVHYWGSGADSSSLKRDWLHHVSAYKYFLKHYPNGFSVFVVPLALLVNFSLKRLIKIWRKTDIDV
jgi:GT2 family glycosyltransferase